jgi:hypothetical protein
MIDPQALDHTLAKFDHTMRQLEREKARSDAATADAEAAASQRRAVRQREQLAQTTAALTEWRAIADSALEPFGSFRTPAPVLGMDQESYKHAVLAECQNRLPPSNEYARVPITDLHGDALDVVGGAILDAVRAHANSPTSVPKGTLRERTYVDAASGLHTTEFYGQDSWIKLLPNLSRKVDPRSPICCAESARALMKQR